MTPLFLASRPLNMWSSHIWVAAPTIAVTAPVLVASVPLYRGDAA